ncbi:MAG: hypothetical protein WA865_05360 [Spirulinaceae cyanobacterium]
MSQLPVWVEEKIKISQSKGAKLLDEAGFEPELPQVALAVESHRWAWQPENTSVILIAESHIYTSVQDFSLTVQKKSLPAAAQHSPEEFVRLIYCLGYGEPELLSGETTQRNAGTRQFWDLFGKLTARGKQPRKTEGVSVSDRLEWKVGTLREMQAKGVWVIDASIHGMYVPGGKRVSNQIKSALHRLWWSDYGADLLSRFPQAKVWIIGKTVADDLRKLKIDFQGWIYQPGAGRSPKRNMKSGWAELLRDVGD